MVKLTLTDLLADPLGVGLTQPAPLLPVLDVAGEISQRGVLGGEEEVSLALEDSLEDPEDVAVALSQLQAVLVLPAEVLGRHLVGVHRLQHHLLSGDPVLSQPDPAVPTFPAETQFWRKIAFLLMDRVGNLSGELGGKIKELSSFSSDLCLVHWCRVH